MQTRHERAEARLDRLGDRPPGGTDRFSSEGSFSPPIGDLWESGLAPRGYYIDFSVKAETPDWPPAWLRGLSSEIHVAAVQWGLGAYERFAKGEGEEWLAGALECGDYLLARQHPDGAQRGGWRQLVPMPHTYRLEPPWLSAITQGEGASLLARLHRESGEDRHARGALEALRPFGVPATEGGVAATLGDAAFPEEYPTDPPSYVLNGAIFGLWGLRDAGVLLGDGGSQESFERMTAALAAVLDLYDTGYWSRYDLYPHAITNVASPAYHLLHIRQLQVMNRLGVGAAFGRAAARFESYRARRLARWRALATKVAFRLANPRNSVLALRMPWAGQTAARRRSGHDAQAERPRGR